MRSSDTFSNLKNIAMHALQLSGAAHGQVTQPARRETLAVTDSIGTHLVLPHRAAPTHHLLPSAPAPEAGRKLLNVPTGSVTTSVPLSGCPKAGYTASATVGGGEKIAGLNLLIDTASSDMVLASTACTNCNVSPEYPMLRVDTTVVLTGSWGGSPWSAYEVQSQDFTFGTGASGNALMAALTHQTNVFDNVGCTTANTTNMRQGIAGMGPTDLSSTSVLMGTMFSMTLPKSILGLATCDMGGTMFLGTMPTDYIAGNTLQTPLMQSKYYAVEVTGIQVGSKVLPLDPDTTGPAIISSSDMDIILPQALYTDAVQAITAGQTALPATFFSNGACIVPPHALNTTALPTFALSFLGLEEGDPDSSFTLPATNSYISFSTNATGGMVICPALSSSGTTGPIVLGNTLMRNTMTVVDWFDKIVTLGVSQNVCN